MTSEIMKGFSLIELLIVVAIAGIISALSYGTITQFKEQTSVDQTADGIVAALRTAQSRSRAGEIGPGEVPADFTADGLPRYGVVIDMTSYTIMRTAVSSSGTPLSDAVETFPLETGITLTPATVAISFVRPTGLPDTPQSFIIKKGTGTTARTVTVTAEGVISRS